MRFLNLVSLIVKVIEINDEKTKNKILTTLLSSFLIVYVYERYFSIGLFSVEKLSIVETLLLKFSSYFQQRYKSKQNDNRVKDLQLTPELSFLIDSNENLMKMPEKEERLRQQMKRNHRESYDKILYYNLTFLKANVYILKKENFEMISSNMIKLYYSFIGRLVLSKNDLLTQSSVSEIQFKQVNNTSLTNKNLLLVCDIIGIMYELDIRKKELGLLMNQYKEYAYNENRFELILMIENLQEQKREDTMFNLL